MQTVGAFRNFSAIARFSAVTFVNVLIFLLCMPIMLSNSVSAQDGSGDINRIIRGEPEIDIPFTLEHFFGAPGQDPALSQQSGASPSWGPAAVPFRRRGLPS